MASEELGRYVADSLIKVQNAIPSRPGDSLKTFVDFASLMLNIASLLPNQEVHGLGEEQQLVMQHAIDSVTEIARASLVHPLGYASASVIDLLWSLAKGTRGELRSIDGFFSPTIVRTHRYVGYSEAKDFVGGLSSAELFYETCCAGYQRLKRLVDTEFWPIVDRSLPTLTNSMVAWALPLMFDGMRLRRGLEVAAPCGLLLEGQRAPFGLDRAAALLLRDGETTVERERVGRTVQFLLAAAKWGIRENEPDEQPSEHPSLAILRLEQQLKRDLETCRQTVESRCFVPGKSMRVILDHIAAEAERMTHSHGSCLFFRYAFAFPCLVPKNLRKLHGYDGGLLSVWDACNHLMRLHAQEYGEMLSFHALLCAVMGGIIGGLMSETVTGPFCMHKSTDAFGEVASINNSWPAPSHMAPGCDGVALATGQRKASGGRQVGATTALCDTIERRILKQEQVLTPLVEARFDSALTMQVVLAGLSRLPGRFDSRPSDGIVPLKRLYFAALQQQPGTARTCAYASLLQITDVERISAADGTTAHWRELVGGALLATGPLFCFSRRAFIDSLCQDWKPMPAVVRVLEARQQSHSGDGLRMPQCKQVRNHPVMLPSRAMSLLARRAQGHVIDIVTRVDSTVKSVDGPVFVTRAMEMLNVWANVVYSNADYSALWETSVAHFGCPAYNQKLGP